MVQQGQQAPVRSHRGRAVAVAVGACLLVAAGALFWVLSPGRNDDTPVAAETTAASSSGAPASTSPEADAPVELTASALLTPQEIAGVGLTVGSPVAVENPAIGPLCQAASWSEQWSRPQQSLGQDYPATGAAVSEYVLRYADPAAATAALQRLIADAEACPSPATGGEIDHTGTLPDTSDSAVFLVRDAGRDGTTAVSWVVVARSGDTLAQVAYTTQQAIGTGSGPVDGGDDASGDSPQAEGTAQSLARAALDHLAATD